MLRGSAVRGVAAGQAEARVATSRAITMAANAERFVDLLDQIEMPQCHCLNASNEHTLRHALEVRLRPAHTFFSQNADRPPSPFAGGHA